MRKSLGRSDKIAALYYSVDLIKNLVDGKYHGAISTLEEIKEEIENLSEYTTRLSRSIN